MTYGEGGNLSAADVAAVMGNRGDGFGFGGDGAWWLLVLFLFAANGNGWGNGFGGNSVPYISNDVQRGFDQQALVNGISGLNTSMNSLAMGLQNCCCENRAGIADLKYTIATENCADRSTINDGIRDIIANQTANTQAILDKLCQQEIDALKTQNVALQNQINMATLRESQTAQTAQILANNQAQTQALEQFLNPTPVPAYMVQNPNCCTSNNYGCGCGVLG